MSSRTFRLFLIVVATLFLMSESFAQDTTGTNKKKYPKVMIIQGDTIMAFTIPMAYDIAQKRDSLKVYKKLYDNSQYMVDTLHGAIAIKDQIHEKDSTELALQTQLTKAANKEASVYKDERDFYKKKHKRQKIGFWVAIAGGAAGWIAYIFK